MKLNANLLPLLILFGFLAGQSANGAEEVKFDHGKSARHIPIRTWNSLILFNASVNGGPEGTFILDSGAGISVIDSAFVANSGVDLSGEVKASTTGIRFREARDLMFSLKGVTVSGLNLAALDLTPLESFTGHPVDGVIGYDLLKLFAVRVEYDLGLMSFYDPSEYRYRGRGAVIPLTFTNKWPVVEVCFRQENGKTLTGKAIIDSGSLTPISLNIAGFCQQTVPNPVSMGILGAGAGGCLGRISFVDIGPVCVKNVWAGMPDITEAEESNPLISAVEAAGIGLLGAPLLCRFTLIFNYSNSEIIFEPNRYFEYPFNADCAGMTLIANGEAGNPFTVMAIAAGSPAEKSGLRVGDEIVGVNHYTADQLKLWTLRQFFRKPDGPCRVRVVRGGEELSIPMVLTRQI